MTEDKKVRWHRQLNRHEFEQPLGDSEGGEGNGNSIQYSCLENPMDGGAWQESIGSQRVRHD